MRVRYAVGAAMVGYLAGSFSFARVVGRFAAPDEDVTHTTLALPGGSTVEYEGASATSIAARSGPGWGMLTGSLDMAKAFIPTWYARRRWPDEPYAPIIAASVIAGHNYPLYHHFNGGRGMAPFYGGMLAIDPRSIPVTTVGGTAVGIGVFQDMFVSYTAGMLLTIPWFMWRRQPANVVYAIAANALFAVASRGEIRSYLSVRRRGELAPLPSMKDFARTYDTLTGSHTPEG